MDSTLCARCGQPPKGEADLWGDALCGEGEHHSCYDVAVALVGNDQGAWRGLKQYWALVQMYQVFGPETFIELIQARKGIVGG